MIVQYYLQQPVLESDVMKQYMFVMTGWIVSQFDAIFINKSTDVSQKRCHEIQYDFNTTNFQENTKDK